MHFIYELRCDDCSALIVGEHPLSLEEAVKDALRSIKDDKTLTNSTTDDWFNLILQTVCELNHFNLVSPDSSCNVEPLYWDEVRRRQDLERRQDITANPNNEFQCDHCGRIFDIEDSIHWENKLLCPGCDVVMVESREDERDIDREYDF